MVLLMKRILIAALAFLASATPAAAAERRFSVTDFDRVQVEGPYQVVLVTDRPSAALAVGSREAIDRVSIDVQSRTLRIRPNRSAWGGYPGESAGPVRIELATRLLRAATVNGSGSLAIDKARGLRVELSVAGSGRLGVAMLDADVLIVGLLGSGKVTLAGRAKQLRATIQGTGDLAARDLRAENAQINADTAGSIAVGAGRTAKVTATGQGDVEIVGTPACTVVGHSAAQVSCGR